MLKKIIRNYLAYIVISYIVIYGWQLLEIVILGKLEPSASDTVIGIILILSLTWNYLMMRDVKTFK